MLSEVTSAFLKTKESCHVLHCRTAPVLRKNTCSQARLHPDMTQLWDQTLNEQRVGPLQSISGASTTGTIDMEEMMQYKG